MKSNSGTEKKAIFSLSKDSSLFNFDLIEFEDKSKLIGIVHRNKITFLANFSKPDLFLSEIHSFELLFTDYPESEDINYACAFGVFHSDTFPPSIIFAFGGMTGFLYLILLSKSAPKKLELLSGLHGTIMCLKFLKKTNNRLLSGCQDFTLILWDTQTREILFKFLDGTDFLTSPNCFVF